MGYDLTTDTRTRRQALLIRWYIVIYDSDCFWVYDPSREIRVTIIRFSFHNRIAPTADTVLDRPMRDFIVVPGCCFRPWDLHPESLITEGACTVKMIHSCCTVRTQKRVAEGGRFVNKTA